MSLEFGWNLRKAQANLRKHRVSFAEAASVFSDPLARIFADEAHSIAEQREILIGSSPGGPLTLVCLVEIEAGRSRMISARRATKREQHDYEEHLTS